METQRKKQKQRHENVFTMTSGGLVIAVRNNYFIDSSFVSEALPFTYITSVSKISIPSAVVIYYCAWYTYFWNGR